MWPNNRFRKKNIIWILLGVYKVITKNGQERTIRKMTTVECHLCSKLITANRFKLHMKKVHNSTEKTNSLQCNFCLKKFTFPSDLKTHTRRKHEKTTKGPFICECCGVTLKTACRLKFHLLVCNKDEKPFPCLECSESYGLEHHLRIHVKTAHTATPQVSISLQRVLDT